MEQKKILIVDDENDCRLTLVAELRSAGYKVVSASDAVAAVMMAIQERPDLILLDIGLPARSGIVVMERIAALSTIAMTPIIIVTASDSEETKMHALKNGAVGYFQKPFEIDELLEAIQKALGVSVSGDADTEHQY
ncbi:MAG: response regulator transcription factor [Planctomycetaceae bacterium]|nr:response regulator transcription factor [Planctomycetaceae bacterium]